MPLAQLFLICYAIFALAAPILVVYLIVRHTKLRSEVERLSESLESQAKDYEGQLSKLTARVYALEKSPAPATSATATPESKPAPTPAPPVPHELPSAPPKSPSIPPPSPFYPPATPKEPAPTQAPPASPPPQHIAKPPQAPALPAQPPAAKEPLRPTVPPSAPTSAPKTPSPIPPWPKETEPSAPAKAHDPAPVHPPAPAPTPLEPTPLRPAPAIPHEPAVAARSSAPAPPPREPFRYVQPKPTLAQHTKKIFALEETLGTNWLNKLGIIILVVGLALFGIYEFSTMGAVGKAAISFFASIAFLTGGILFEKHENYRLLGRTLIGGGWALFFFTSYGVYHVGAMRVVNSLTLDCVLMLLVAIAMGVHTLRYHSQFVTGLAFLLGYTTVALSHDTVYSLSAGVILAIGLVLIVLKMSWFELEVFGILSSYLNHLYWLYRLLGPEGAHRRAFPEYHASLAMLLFYWLTFRISYVVRRTKSAFEEHVSTAGALLNTILLLGAMKFQSVQPQLAYLALLGIGALEFAIAQLPITRRRRTAVVLLSVMGAALMIAAPPFHFSANNVVVLWLLGAELFLFAGILVKEVVFRRLGLLTGVLVGIHLALVDFAPVMKFRAKSDDALVPAGILFVLCAVILSANALACETRWKAQFESYFDYRVLQLHSYIAAASAMVGAWALVSDDWTALAFAGVMLALALLASGFPSRDLRIQYFVVAVVTFVRTLAVNLHGNSPTGVHLNARLISLPILAAAFYLVARLACPEGEVAKRAVPGVFTTMGSALLALLIWYEVPSLWQPVAFIAFALLISEVARALPYPWLAWHTHAVSVLALFTALTPSRILIPVWHGIPVYCFSALPVLAGFYCVAVRPGSSEERHHFTARALYTWAAAGLAAWVLWQLLPAPWIAVGWIAYGVTLVLVARQLQYSQLFWQTNALAVLAVIRAFGFNYGVEQKLWHALDLRTVTVSLVAAGLYFLARRAAPDPESKRYVAYLHSFAATGLLALLGWYETPNGWLAPLWAGFALALALIDRQFDLEELGWQTHILSLLALLRCATYNLYLTVTWHDVSVRLLSLTLVAAFFYVMSRASRMPQEWRERDLHHVYSWAASTLISLVLWYELVPLNIAIGWAVFGLVLFEYGLWRDVRQFRLQSYVALFASFVRIFFANLAIGEPGQFWGPRTYTILPLVLIYFFVYEQSTTRPSGTGGVRESSFTIGALLATLGTATVIALFYFQFPLEWVVTSWAAVVLALFAITFFLDRDVFLYQALLLTLLVFARGMVHNLFGAGYFTDGDWKGRFFVLGSAIGLLLLSLGFALPLRERYKAKQRQHAVLSILAKLAARPEQFEFFVAMILLSSMLALKMRAGMVTVSWGIEGVLIILLALAVKERSFRLAGLGLLLLCVGKVLAMDVWGLQPRDRYVTFIIVGAALLFVSYLYSRYREAIRQLL